jgi:hypothetical protein
LALGAGLVSVVASVSGAAAADASLQSALARENCIKPVVAPLGGARTQMFTVNCQGTSHKVITVSCDAARCLVLRSANEESEDE